MRRILGLLAALLLAALLCCPAAAQSSFTGKVTLYSRSKREAYVQNGTTGKLVRLDKSNGDRLDEIKAGKVLTVSGFEVTHEQGGYLLPEISDAMIESISDGGASATTVNATLDQLGNGLMAVRVRVKGTKAQLSSANLQLSLDGYEDGQTLTVTGVLSANTHGRIILGASIQAEAPATPEAEPTSAPSPTPDPTEPPTPVRAGLNVRAELVPMEEKAEGCQPWGFSIQTISAGIYSEPICVGT